MKSFQNEPGKTSNHCLTKPAREMIDSSCSNAKTTQSTLVLRRLSKQATSDTPSVSRYFQSFLNIHTSYVFVFLRFVGLTNCFAQHVVNSEYLGCTALQKFSSSNVPLSTLPESFILTFNKSSSSLLTSRSDTRHYMFPSILTGADRR